MVAALTALKTELCGVEYRTLKGKLKMKTRIELLEAVAEAARVYATTDYHHATYDTLMEALAALDALPAEPQPQGETVTLAVWRNDRGTFQFAAPDTAEDTPVRTWRRLGTVTLPLDRESGR